jgi:hypothetical protein
MQHHHARNRSQGISSRKSADNLQRSLPLNNHDDDDDDDYEILDDHPDHYEPMQTAFDAEACCECCPGATMCDSIKRWSFVILVAGMAFVLLKYLISVALVFFAAIATQMFSTSNVCQKNNLCIVLSYLTLFVVVYLIIPKLGTES